MAKTIDPLELAEKRAERAQQPDTRTQGGPRAPYPPARPRFTDPVSHIADSLERLANAAEFIAAYLAEEDDDGDGERADDDEAAE